MISSDSGFWIDIFILLLVLVVGLLWLLWYKWGYKHMDHPIDHHLGRHEFCSPRSCETAAFICNELIYQDMAEEARVQSEYLVRRCRASKDNDRWG